MIEDTQVEQVPVGHLVFADEPAGIYATVFKPAVDILTAGVLLVCCLPLMLVVMLLIVLDSSGSPVFVQSRVGRNGRPFDLYKFRTMPPAAEKLGFKTAPDDERITRLGKLLRDSKIDELPQLLNVLLGQMSLIGPRPLSVEETEHLVRSGTDMDTPGLYPEVLPGLTGLEQCTRSSLHPFEHRFWLNHYYERHVSFWIDLWVLKRTVGVCPLVCLLALASSSLSLLGWSAVKLIALK